MCLDGENGANVEVEDVVKRKIALISWVIDEMF